MAPYKISRKLKYKMEAFHKWNIPLLYEIIHTKILLEDLIF